MRDAFPILHFTQTQSSVRSMRDSECYDHPVGVKLEVEIFQRPLGEDEVLIKHIECLGEATRLFKHRAHVATGCALFRKQLFRTDTAQVSGG